MFKSHGFLITKELYTGTRPTQIYVYFVLQHYGRNVNKPSAPTEVEEKGLNLWCDIKVQQTKLIYQVRANTYDFWFLVNIENTIAIYSYSIPWAIFPQKWCVALEFFVLISSHCSTQIWRMRYDGSWSIYVLFITMVWI